MVNCLVADWAGSAASVTLAVNVLAVSGPVGVPVIVPFELSVNPFGNDPLCTENAYGGSPPITPIVVRYCVWYAASGKDVDENASGGTTWTLTCSSESGATPLLA